MGLGFRVRLQLVVTINVIPPHPKSQQESTEFIVDGEMKSNINNDGTSLVVNWLHWNCIVFVLA
jgi:hypothetical protein